MRVVVKEYDPIWAHQFQQIKEELERVLEGVQFTSIEHVGSTSVPGLAAKPVLDIDIIVSPEDFEPVKRALVEKGRYAFMGDWGIAERYVFQRPAENPARNLYVCFEGCQSLRNHLLLRDLCRRDASVREAYGRKKLELSEQDWANVDEYCEAKNEIIQFILEKAGMEQHDLDEIRRRNVAAVIR